MKYLALARLSMLLALAACSSTSNSGSVPPAAPPVVPTVLATYALPGVNTLVSEITAGPDGNVWLYEGSANKVARVTPAGNFTEFSIPTANFEGTGITSGPDGNLWIAEDSGVIARLTPSGVFTEFPVGNEQPTGITFGPDGRVWFTDYTPGKVGAMTTTGAVTFYTLPNTSTFPFSIAKGADGNLWVCARGGTGKIDRVSTSGVVTEFALPGTEGCNGIAAGSDGNVYFGPYNGKHLGKVTPSGAISLIAASGFINQDLTLGKDGKVYFGIQGAVTTLGSVAPDGTEKEYGLSKSVCALAAGPDGNLWANDCDNYKIFKVAY